MGVEGIAITAMGPRICTARKAPGARATSAPGRSHEARGSTTTPAPAAPAHSLVSSGRASSSRRRRPSSTRPPSASSPSVVTGTVSPVETNGKVARSSFRSQSVGGLVLLGRRRRDEEARPDDTRLWAGAAGAGVVVEPRASWLRPGADVDRAPGAFLAVQILGPMAVIAMPSTPIFGGVKRFVPAMPYLAVLAAIGLGFAHHLLRARL